MRGFLHYQPENNFVRRHERSFQEYPKENYKMSMYSKRKNPHGDAEYDIAHLLCRRADGRAVHTPEHIESQRKHHELKARLSPPKFDIIKVRHDDHDHHANHIKMLKDQEKKRIKHAHVRKYENGESESNPINHMHCRTGEPHAVVPRRPGRKLAKYDAHTSYSVGRALLHAPFARTNCNARVRKHAAFHRNRLPPNSLLYGWGAENKRKTVSGKKLLGPSLAAALTLSPRAYPERLPKHLEMRRRPQEEYRAERKEAVKILKRERVDATKMMSEVPPGVPMGGCPMKGRRRMTTEGRGGRHQTSCVLGRHQLNELKQSILHLPPLRKGSLTAR
jgi:hypothetical protein